MANKEITIITPAADISGFPRMNKLLQMLSDKNIGIHHWFWQREETKYEARQPNIHPRVIFKGGGYSNKKLIFYYVGYILAVIWQGLKARNAYFYCIGFASAFPIYVVSRFNKNVHYLFDNNDNISKSHAWPPLVKKVLEHLETRVALGAKLHMVPSLYRWSRQDSNLRVAPNVPGRKVIEQARSIASSKQFQRDQFTLYVNGQLTQTRGILQMLEVMKQWDPAVKMRVLVAGKIKCDEAKQLAAMPGVEFLGELSNEASLAEYYRSSLTLTYYDPAIEINRLAEPNKWGDCVITETPFVVNSEVVTAKPFLERKACFAVPYHDTRALTALLVQLAQDPRQLDVVRENLQSFHYLPWEDHMDKILNGFLN